MYEHEATINDGSISGDSMMICREERLLNGDNCVANHVVDGGKEHLMSSEFCSEVPSKLYQYPTPYASNQVKYTTNTQLKSSCSNSQTATLTKHPLNSHPHFNDRSNEVNFIIN